MFVVGFLFFTMLGVLGVCGFLLVVFFYIRNSCCVVCVGGVLGCVSVFFFFCWFLLLFGIKGCFSVGVVLGVSLPLEAEDSWLLSVFLVGIDF